jgi:hypothetical protein
VAPTTLRETRLGEDMFKLIGQSLYLCDFLTDGIAYGSAAIRHCSTLLLEALSFSSVKTTLPFYYSL